MKLISPERSLANDLICFTTMRDAGCSRGPYQSFNLADNVGDCQQDVEANRHTLFSYLNNLLAIGSGRQLPAKDIRPLSKVQTRREVHALCFLQQIHSAKVTTYEESTGSWSPSDAIFTAQPLTPLAVLSADCLPIVLVGQFTFESAAVHAGWKGLRDGVIQNALHKFNTPANTISAWIGPSICQRHFEVGTEVAEYFSQYAPHILPSAAAHKHHIDLSAIAAQILLDCGVVSIQQSGVCTYCNDQLYSFRRATHEGLQNCGRMATVVLRY